MFGYFFIVCKISSMKRFSVVQFYTEPNQPIAAVPNSWLTEEGDCYWPPSSWGPIKKDRAASTEMPPDATWAKWPIYVKKRTGKILKLIWQRVN
jgi:hypothetical protein